MADDKTKKGQADSSRINMSESYEVSYWMEVFDVSEKELQDAVKKVGNSVSAVRAHLRG
jgi:hypothetical protein